jgi:hypothetical protein
MARTCAVGHVRRAMRAKALTFLLALLVTQSLGCSATVRVTLACEHCFCSWGSRDLRHPMSCDALGYDLVCCIADSS